MPLRNYHIHCIEPLRLEILNIDNLTFFCIGNDLLVVIVISFNDQSSNKDVST
jgi:hypothetical protein